MFNLTPLTSQIAIRAVGAKHRCLYTFVQGETLSERRRVRGRAAPNWLTASAISESLEEHQIDFVSVETGDRDVAVQLNAGRTGSFGIHK